jgi:hypothetical protein
MKSFTIKVPIHEYGSQVYLIFNLKGVELLEELQRISKEVSGGEIEDKFDGLYSEMQTEKVSATTYQNKRDPSIVIIYVNDFKFTPFKIGTLVHEIFHAMNSTFDNHGIKFKGRRNEEVQAYMLGYLTREVIEKIFEVWKLGDEIKELE